jgi:hypothetical protein
MGPAILGYLSMAKHSHEVGPLIADLITCHDITDHTKTGSALNEFNTPVAKQNLMHIMSDCDVIVIEGKDGKILLSQVIIEMDLIAACLSDEIIKIAFPSYSSYRAVKSQEKNYPIMLCRDPITNRTIIAITCPQASNLFSWTGTNFDYSLTVMLIHTRYHLAATIKGAQYQEEFLPDFTSVDQSPLCDLNTKEGASIVTKWMDNAGLIEGDKVSFQSSREVTGSEGKSRGGKKGIQQAVTNRQTEMIAREGREVTRVEAHSSLLARTIVDGRELCINRCGRLQATASIRLCQTCVKEKNKRKREEDEKSGARICAECDEEIVGRMLKGCCNQCHQRQYRKTGRVIDPAKKCTHVSGCDNKKYMDGLCQRHYKERRLEASTASECAASASAATAPKER